MMQMYVLKTNFEMVTTHTVCVLSTSNSLTGTISAIYVSQLLKVETATGFLCATPTHLQTVWMMRKL